MCILNDLELPESADPAVLSQWDEAGYPPGPGEDLPKYRSRLEAKKLSVQELNIQLAATGEAIVFDSVKVLEKERISPEILEEAAEVTSSLYGFSFKKFPGFFLSENVGLLWGGCLITDTESPLGIFFIRASFRKKQRFFIYRRRELMAHELCHAARHELSDWEMDEFFAYQTSPSRLRRYLGNCFIRQMDAVLFMLPAMLLLAAQVIQFLWVQSLPVWPFWAAALGYPAWLLIRNQRGRNRLFRAEKKLAAFGIQEPRKVLFRSTAEERRIFAGMRSAEELRHFLAEKAGELRWKVIIHRFFPDEYKA